MDLVEEEEFQVELMTPPRWRPGLAARRSWSLQDVDEVLRRCDGAIVLGLPRWVFGAPDEQVRLANEFCQYEGGVAHTLGIPTHVLAESGIAQRCFFWDGAGHYIITFPPGSNRRWLAGEQFQDAFRGWLDQLNDRRDIFLGYCSRSSQIADLIRAELKRMKVRVLDWQNDFTAGGTILEQVEEAASRCRAGVFLFTRDDLLTDETAVPRDNVVFEAGYFASAKGPDRVLIIREEGSKMPADLGGRIYAPLESRDNIRSVRDQLRQFVEQRL